MKRMLPLLLALLCALPALAEEAPALTLGNPWVTLEAAAVPPGLPLRLPLEAEDVLWRSLPALRLTEVQFTLGGTAWVARCMPAEALEDISGMYYQWATEQPVSLGDAEALLLTAPCEAGTALVFLWHDTETGMTCSLAAVVAGEAPDAAEVAAMAAGACPGQ